jgi:hypothetical protein
MALLGLAGQGSSPDEVAPLARMMRVLWATNSTSAVIQDLMDYLLYPPMAVTVEATDLEGGVMSGDLDDAVCM